jgi:hypothetical protein
VQDLTQQLTPADVPEQQTFRHDAVKGMLYDVLRPVSRLEGVVMENAMFAEFGKPD